MSKLNDSSAIKLFGKTIPFPILNQEEASADHVGNAAREDANLVSSSNSLTGVISNDGIQAMVPREKQVSVEKELVKDKKEDNSSHQIREDLNAPTNLSDIGDNATSPSPERKTSSAKGSKNDEISETTSSQDKTLKKPDKILPCPRCNSKETKFCYYNNYNVNQPRHFCKNCQRYWTAGGTMRNVPVGAGRRKTKTSSALQYHHIIISEAIRAAQAGIHPNPSCENKNAHILGFGSNSFNLPGKAQINVQKGFHRPEQRVPFEDNRSNESLINASYPLQNEGKAGFNQAEQVKNLHWLRPAKAPSFPRPSWPYPWDSIPAIIPPPPPPLFPPGFPASFDRPPATYSSYSVPNPWDVPVASPSPASSVNQCPPRSNPTSPTLGKHSREVNILNKEKLSILKTLRIDDSDETAKSSMLATLVAKSKKINSSNSGGLFEGFQSKASDERNYRLETFSVMRANPAALSRSVNFHENT